jgi:hypothetical protein
VLVVALGVLLDGEPELMSVLAPGVGDAPMDVPLPLLVPLLVPVPELEPAVVSVLLGAVAGAVPDMLPVDEELLVEPLGDVVGGVVLELVDEEVEESVGDVAASSLLPQADRDRAAIRARAAHCAIGDLIIGNSLVSFRNASNVDWQLCCCLRLTLVTTLQSLVVWRCRSL